VTVALVVVSHSEKIADGAAELAAQMAPDVSIVAAGGTPDGRIGTSLEKVMAALEQAAGADGVVILTDLGSAVMTAESALEFAGEPDGIVLADAPLVEGLVAAAVAAQGGADVHAVKRAAEAAYGSARGVPPSSSISAVEEGSVTGKRQTEHGYDVISSPLPAVVAVSDAINEPRYPSLKGIMSAKTKPQETLSLADVGVDAGAAGEAGAATTVLALGPPASRGDQVKIEDDGSAAQKILDLVVERKLL